MGQSASAPRSVHRQHHHHHHTQTTAFWRSNKAGPAPPMIPPDPPNFTSSKDIVFSPPDLTRDFTDDIPDECLALIFHSLGSGDRKRCSLVCRRWLSVESSSRHRLSLDARAALLDAIPGLFSRFDSVAKLSLKCERRSDSIGDEALALISQKCPLLTRLKLRACRQISDVGMSILANNCKNLKKLSCGSSTFGAKGISVVVSSCSLLEELSIKRLRGLTDEGDLIVPPKSSSLKSICLKEIFNGQFFGPLIAESPKLKTLKLFRCSGDWDKLLEDITWKVPGLVEVHLEKIQVSDRGLCAFTSCLELEIFHLVKTPDCTDAGISAVARKCKLLRKIHIDGWKSNRIGDEGLSTVAQNCRNVQELVLIGVNPTLVSVGLIAENCKNLERLALCGSDTIGDAEISCIASKCVSLKKLCIKSCQVSNQGMEALGTGCPNLVIVEFYAPWCGHCKGLAPIYEKLAAAFRMDEHVVIANVDADKHKELGEKYGISGFPTLKFFPKSNKAGEDYNGGREIDDFTTFINEKCGTNRDGNGHLTAKAGKIESLDDLVKEFLGVANDEKAAVLSKIEEEADKLMSSSARYGKIYVKAAKSVIAKGANYARNEIARLERMLEKSISAAKADEFIIKKNILSTFNTQTI